MLGAMMAAMRVVYLDELMGCYLVELTVVMRVDLMAAYLAATMAH